MALGETFNKPDFFKAPKAGSSAFGLSSSTRGAGVRRGCPAEVPCGRAGLWLGAALPPPRT